MLLCHIEQSYGAPRVRFPKDWLNLRNFDNWRFEDSGIEIWRSRGSIILSFVTLIYIWCLRLEPRTALLKSGDSNYSSAGAPAIARTGLGITTVFLVQGTEEQGIELIGTCLTQRPHHMLHNFSVCSHLYNKAWRNQLSDITSIYKSHRDPKCVTAKAKNRIP